MLRCTNARPILRFRKVWYEHTWPNFPLPGHLASDWGKSVTEAPSLIFNELLQSLDFGVGQPFPFSQER